MKTTPVKHRRATRYPCIFSGKFVREQVDPRVQDLWKKATGNPAPFGKLRLAFQNGQCQAVNPYGSTDCPYREEECAMAFLGAVQSTLLPWVENPAVYFVKLCRSLGAERADNKPLARERHREEGPGYAGDVSGDSRAGSPGPVGTVRGKDSPSRIVREVSDLSGGAAMRRSANRPAAIGDVLGALHLGPHPRPERNGRGEEEGAK